ncbi:hypothetical protein [Mangrovibacterium lignilyticum]|uniref:hypothetical protein n=1 Tax=Mangrovibacterium lignilyticum TaxID=2668052 RepID=UPI0013D1DCE6|nr:hypothetical protein [Mangrovibacterium lignilyticum]
MKLLVFCRLMWVSFIEIMTAMGTHTFKGYFIAIGLCIWYFWWVIGPDKGDPRIRR